MGEISKGALLYEGKAKRLYETENPAELLVEFKDDLTAFDNVKKGQMVGKGAVNNQVSAIIMGLLNEAGIETNFIRPVDTNHCLFKRVEIVMVEVIVRYEAQGSFCKRYGIEPGLPCRDELTRPFGQIPSLLFRKDIGEWAMLITGTVNAKLVIQPYPSGKIHARGFFFIGSVGIPQFLLNSTELIQSETPPNRFHEFAFTFTFAFPYIYDKGDKSVDAR